MCIGNEAVQPLYMHTLPHRPKHKETHVHLTKEGVDPRMAETKESQNPGKVQNDTVKITIE